MLKKSIIGLVVVALMVTVADAGVKKIEDWTGRWVCVFEGDAQAVCTLKVMMKIPWWIRIKPQPDIMLEQKALHQDPDKPEYGRVDYEGTSPDMEVCANFAGKLSTAVETTDDGKCLDAAEWYSSISPTDFTQCCTPGYKVTVGFKKGDLHNKEACKTLHVANVTILVVPIKTCECEICP